MLERFLHRVRHAGIVCAVTLGLAVVGAADAGAQAPAAEPSEPLLQEVARRVAFDPTTYAPTIVVHTGRQLDWESSQAFFRIGYLEQNPRFTVSGLPADAPVSYAAGNRRIARDVLGVLGRSAANNAVCAFVERALIARAPQHRRLIRTVGWIERVSFGSYWAYKLSHRNFEQWRANERLARELGAR